MSINILGGYLFKGWTGKILWIDLSKKKFVTEKYGSELALKYLGGRGYAIKILWDHLPPNTDPLSPENLLIFAVGPLTGLSLPSSGKMVVASKSPLTGGYGDGNIGTKASVNMKLSGYDMFVIKGRFDKPHYLFIDKSGVKFIDAGDLWGLDASKVHDHLEKEYGKQSGILTIGPAGERLLRYAVVMSERDRAGGRPGMGAVMGSKNLKAIVIDGDGEIPVYDADEIRRLGGEGYRAITSSELYSHWMREGTMTILEWCQENSVLPTYNFKEGVFEDADKVTGEVMSKEFKVSQKGCPKCNMVCGNVAEAKTGDFKNIRAEMDYENVAMLGPNIGIGDLNKIIGLIRICDNYGVDTISMGSVIAFTIEAFKKGLIKSEDLGGIKPEWGDIYTASDLINLTIEGKKFGGAMAMGTKYMAKKLGGDSEVFAMNVKGLEISAYDCHVAYGMALAYGTSPIGAHHKDAWFITRDFSMGIDNYGPDKVSAVIWMQNIRGGMFETLVTCRFPWIELGFDLEWYPKFLYAATGVKISSDNISLIAERIYTLIRLFWIREYGYWDKTFDYPPMRWFKEPLTKGQYKGRHLDINNYDTMLVNYYEMRGWDNRGFPRLNTLKKLGLEEEGRSIAALGIKLR